ncbi:Collagen alpha-2(IX) chain, partial [Ophiophagus hannah]
MSSSPLKERRSPVGLDCCSCCLDLANGPLGYNSNLSPLLQLREQLAWAGVAGRLPGREFPVKRRGEGALPGEGGGEGGPTANGFGGDPCRPLRA